MEPSSPDQQTNSQDAVSLTALFADFEQRMFEKQEAHHQDTTDQINKLKEQIDPISKVYSQVIGFGSVAVWLFRYVAVPISIVLGIFLTWKNLNK